MLMVLNRYKTLLIVLAIIALVVLIWLVSAAQNKNGIPSRGVFVFRQLSGSSRIKSGAALRSPLVGGTCRGGSAGGGLCERRNA